MHQLLRTSPDYTPTQPQCARTTQGSLQLRKNTASPTPLLVFQEQRLGSQFVHPVSMQPLLATEHHGGKEGSRHTVIRKDEEHGNQVLEEEQAVIRN